MTLEAHTERKPGIGVGVVVINKNGEILLGKRNGKFAKGTWALPGGHVEKFESVKEAAVRELLEESGLEAVARGRFISAEYEILYGKDYLTFGVFVEANGNPEVVAPGEIVDWKYFPLSDLPEPLFLPSKRILENFKSGILHSLGNKID